MKTTIEKKSAYALQFDLQPGTIVSLPGLIKSGICYNQGEFIQYSFLASEFHKKVKQEFLKPSPDKYKIHDNLLALEDFLNRSFGRVSSDNFAYIKRFFEGRSKRPVRVCIKANFGPEEKNIIPIFRDENVRYNSECQIHQNTGHFYVSENGKYYICNDIPEEAKKGNYLNPRLKKARVDLYKKPNWLKKYFLKKQHGYLKDSNWISCWTEIEHKDGADVSPPENTCYKSTLIIPMTLWNNDLVPPFIELFNMEDVERTIFGYLCLDHVEPDYFNEDIDIHIGYIFADILSLYLICRLIYTTRSITFKKAWELVNN